MKLFEVPMVVTSLVGLFCLSGLGTPPAHADFTFGEPVSVGRVIPALDSRDAPISSATLDGLEMYFHEADRQGGQGGYDLWVLKRDSIDADWRPPENLGPAVNGPSLDCNPAISPDGLTLYFTSGRPGGYGGDDLYMTTRATRNAPWGQAVNMGPKVNTPQGDGSPRVSPDNLELYFESDRPGGYGGLDIYVCRRATASDPWGDPVNLGPVVNSPYDEAVPHLSPDGLLLIFSDFFVAGARPGGYGNVDAWVARRATLASPWQTPVNMGPIINSQGFDIACAISPDGSTLYLWSNQGTGQSIYQAPILPIVDFNGDAKVDEEDLALLLVEVGKKTSVCDIGPFAWGDGVVDDEDLKVFMEYSMTPGPQTADVACNVVLTWVSLSLPQGYDVYLGTSAEAVQTASRTNPQGVLVSQGQPATAYAPAQPLAFSTTYYWRVDEVNAVMRPGEVWSFTTVYYPDLVVDDFESYAASGGNDLFATWVDGYFGNFTTNGAAAGLFPAVNGSFCESTIVHGGKQSLPLAYDNSNAPLSEVVRTFDHAQDWTAGGIKTLSLWFQGVAGNTGQLYVKINGTKVLYDGAASNLAKPAWTGWNIDLSKLTGVNKVSSLTIGIEGAGAQGTLYLDDICLTP